MTVRLNPYLNFVSSAEAALTLYQSIFGGELTLSRFGENGMAQDPADADKIMHGQLETANGFTLMASDAPPGMPLSEGSSMSVSLSGDDEATLRGYWNGLVAGGQVTVPLEKAPWGDTFGMLTDKFGIAWLVNISGTPS
ncbi:VOC family protein [Devosia sp. SL43]|uniref:VOC family protein n=1 Tax=Devosia sp. SL43 TaxID=2806348 RepID=UPI001F3F49E5|nr:VOC family protein [Devosia sp. SL43]UJW86251.1 VOC family protein [Devosia sp. SL43]